MLDELKIIADTMKESKYKFYASSVLLVRVYGLRFTVYSLRAFTHSHPNICMCFCEMSMQASPNGVSLVSFVMLAALFDVDMRMLTLIKHDLVLIYYRQLSTRIVNSYNLLFDYHVARADLRGCRAHILYLRGGRGGGRRRRE